MSADTLTQMADCCRSCLYLHCLDWLMHCMLPSHTVNQQHSASATQCSSSSSLPLHSPPACTVCACRQPWHVASYSMEQLASVYIKWASHSSAWHQTIYRYIDKRIIGIATSTHIHAGHRPHRHMQCQYTQDTEAQAADSKQAVACSANGPC